MTAVLQVVRLGRAARSEANLKVRQPLPAVLVHTTDVRDTQAVIRLKDQILEELNVKDVKPLEELADVVAWDVKPNLPKLGPKYGKRLGAVRKALASKKADDVAIAVNEGKTVDLGAIDDTEVVLQPDEVLVSLRKREGFAAAQGDGATVALDTELTDELIAEGLARDFIRSVQDARKRLDLRIEQTIRLTYATSDNVIASAIEANRDFIAREVLATEVTRTGDLRTGTTSVKVGEGNATIEIAPNA